MTTAIHPAPAPAPAAPLHLDVQDAITALNDVIDTVGAPGGWARCAAARNADGAAVDVEDDSAVAYCLTGALEMNTGSYAYPRRVYAIGIRAIRACLPADAPFNDPAAYNDSLDAPDGVLAVCRNAIRHLESNPQYI